MARFEQDQRNYYLKELNRSLPATGSFDQSALERALQVDDILVPGGRQGEVAQMVSTYGMNSAAIQRDTACRALSSPVGMRDPTARTGCGWWFTPDPTKNSVAAYGARHGPMAPNLDTLYGTGQWIWGPEEAAQAEGLKQAAKIQACPDIQFSKYPNMGWCPSTNMAIVTDGAGNPLYPGAAGGDCPGGGIVMSAANCPPPPPPPGSGGGSGSGGPAIPNSVSSLCNTNPLTPECMSALLPYAGCANSGALGWALSSGYPGQSQYFNDANADLVRRGFTLNASLINDGSLALGDAFNSMVGLQRQASAGIKSAQNLCLNGNIDYCPGPTDTGPFTMGCIIKAAGAMGYPAASPLLADPSNFAYYDATKTWQNLLDSLSNWMDDTTHTGPEYATALYYVYGISLKLPPLPALPIGTRLSLRPLSAPQKILRHQDFQLWAQGPDNIASVITYTQTLQSSGYKNGGSLYSNQMASDGTFLISPPNNGVANYVSIQSVNFPGYFLIPNTSNPGDFSVSLVQAGSTDPAYTQYGSYNDMSTWQIIPNSNGTITFAQYSNAAGGIAFSDAYNQSNGFPDGQTHAQSISNDPVAASFIPIPALLKA